MADVTVEKLAGIVGAPVDRLLKQMQEAGLKQTAPDDAVSDDEKQVLLAFLKRSHGESDAAPKKITLKRKVTTTLKAGGTAGRGKTVNVEVRKKRTYVKRSEVEPDAPVEEETLEAAVPETEVTETQPTNVETVSAEATETETAETAPAEVEPAPAEEETVESAPVESAAEEAASTEEKASEKKRTSRLRIVSEAPAKPAKPAATPSGHGHHRTAPKTAGDTDSTRGDKRPGKKAAPKPGGKSKNVKRLIDQAAEELHLGEGAGSKRSFKEPKIAKATDFLQAHKFERPAAPVEREVAIPEQITVAELAQRMAIKGNLLVKTLMKMGAMATINQVIDQETAILAVEELGRSYVLEETKDIEQQVLETVVEASDDDAKPRAPVVTVMGHVDHGKTSLLDYIRRTKVTDGEAGGITQHIGAYHVETDKGMVSFLDTPGHEAFTAMRARGAGLTDVVILVVAADDGVMPQTEEAVHHSRSAGVPMVVAVNKIDKEAADPDRVKNELSAKDVIPEDWGGDVQFVPVSAHTGEGIDDLLEAVLLQAELLELTAVDEGPAKGVVVESTLEKGRGAVATLLVQSGTLKQGDIVLAGQEYGRVRAMLDENGQPVKSAGPSIPVAMIGLASTPNAGDEFVVLPNERKAREVAEHRAQQTREAAQERKRSANLENLFASMGEGEVKTLNIVLKTDVRGTLEALTSSLEKIGNDEVKVSIVYGGVGGISGTDANLAVSTDAIIVGFNTRADNVARKVIEDNGVELRYYSVIYDIVDDVKNALSGMLSPEFKEEIVGIAEVRDVFNSPKYGQIAGCMVVEGTVYRNKPIRVLRDDVVIYEGELESLRRFKDDVNEVRNNMECGIGVKNYNDVKAGDKIEVFDTVEIERTL